MMTTVSNSNCQPSCVVADSILTNIMREKDPSLDAVKCSFLSYLFEVCWETAIQPERHDECRPSVDHNMREVATFYRQHCLSNSCFSLFSVQRQPRDHPGQSRGQPNGQKGSPCSRPFERLLQSLLKPDCKGNPNRTREMEREFKDCAEREAATMSCRQETGQFIDTFLDHVRERKHSCWSTGHFFGKTMSKCQKADIEKRNWKWVEIGEVEVIRVRQPTKGKQIELE